MRTSVVFGIAAVSFVFVPALPTPAAAMELREAIKRCDASPGCTYTLDKSGATIFGPKGGVVSCPPKQGQCGVIGRTKGGKPGSGTVMGALSGSTKGQGKISTKTTASPGTGKHPIEHRPVAQNNAGRVQAESRAFSTGSGGGSKKH